MKLFKILALLALLISPAAFAQQQQVNCSPGTPCTTGGPSNTGSGDPLWDAFGKLNANDATLFTQYVRAAAEISAGITPTNYGYPPGNILRYGADATGVADSGAAFTKLVSVINAGFGVTAIPPGTYTTASTMTLPQAAGCITAYSATWTYTGSGAAFTSPTTGYMMNPCILGLTISATSSTTNILQLYSPWGGIFSGLTLIGNSQTVVALELQSNTSGTLNPAGNYNAFDNTFYNILFEGTQGTSVHLLGQSSGPVTGNRFYSLHTGSGGPYVYGVNLDAHVDTNTFLGGGLNCNSASTSCIGIVFNSNTPASNVGVYNDNFIDFYINCFGSPGGDARVGAVFNWTKQNYVRLYQSPSCAGGTYTKTANTQSSFVDLLNDTSGNSRLIQLPITIAPTDSAVPLNIAVPSGQVGVIITPTSSSSALVVPAGSGNAAQIVLRGNGNASGFNIAQSSTGDDILNGATGNLHIETASVDRITITNGGIIAATAPLTSGGTTFTVASGTGACATTSTLHGGVQVGDLKCTGTTGASTVTLTLAAATTGYTCAGRDLTTPTTLTQTGAISTTSVTLTMTSVTANDVIQFHCLGY